MLFGLFYSLSGYKKDGAKYYKMSMIFYTFSSVVTLYSLFRVAVTNNYSLLTILQIVLGAIVLACSCMLSFSKDLGKEKSINLSYIIFSSSIVNIIITGVVQGFSNLYRFLIFVVEAALVVVFISAKYKDKESRNAK